MSATSMGVVRVSGGGFVWRVYTRRGCVVLSIRDPKDYPAPIEVLHGTVVPLDGLSPEQCMRKAVCNIAHGYGVCDCWSRPWQRPSRMT